VTLLEILVGSVILVLVSVPIGLLLSSSSGRVKQVDQNREVRLLIDRIVNRIEVQDFVGLWDQFGVEPDSPTRMTDRLADFDPATRTAAGRNPLGLDDEVLGRLADLGLAASLEFRFLTKKELGIDPSQPLVSTSGLLHLQAGTVRLRVAGRGLWRGGVNEEIVKNVYCPMILGRPGLLLTQCPSVNPALRDGKFKGFP
jgi:hypothetical protein